MNLGIRACLHIYMCVFMCAYLCEFRRKDGPVIRCLWFSP